jgi:hypothetical protein
MLFADVDVAARAQRAELAVAAADIDDADERVCAKYCWHRLLSRKLLPAPLSAETMKL